MNGFKLKAIFYKLQAPYYKLLLSSSLDSSDEFFGRSRDFISRLAATGEGTAGTDGDAAGFDPVAGVFDVDTACRHERSLQQGAGDTMNWAPARMAMRAVMASRTVPAPMMTSGLSAYFLERASMTS